MKTKIIILIVLVAAIAAVGFWALKIPQQPDPEQPKQEPMDRATFVLIYADLAIAGEKIGVGTPQYEAVRDSILKSHGTTFGGFTAMQSSLDTKPEDWAKVWENILAELEKRKATLIPIDSSKAH